MSKHENIEEIVREIISERFNVDKTKFTGASLLKEELGIDSFGAVELIFEFKDRFGIEIPQEDFAKIKRVKDIVEYISDHKAKE